VTPCISFPLVSDGIEEIAQIKRGAAVLGLGETVERLVGHGYAHTVASSNSVIEKASHVPICSVILRQDLKQTLLILSLELARAQGLVTPVFERGKCGAPVGFAPTSACGKHSG